MINLNTTDVNELVLKLSKALFNVLDCEAMRDIECVVECSEDDLENIYQMRKIASKIAFEKKFVPLDKDNATWRESSHWYANSEDCTPCNTEELVDIMFRNDKEIHSNFPPKYLDWTLDGSESDIQFWRYSNKETT